MDADIGRYKCWFDDKGGYKSWSDIDIKRGAKIFPADIKKEEKNVIKPHLKIRVGHCERSEHGPPGFSGVVWCSIKKGGPNSLFAENMKNDDKPSRP